MLPPRLALDLEKLDTSDRPQISQEGGFANLVFSAFPTGPHFNAPTTTLLIRVPLSYPDAGLDMFWTDPSLLLAGGAVPKNAEALEYHAGRQWRRFSWHHHGWNPAHHNLSTYLAFVRRRFDVP